MAAPTHNAAQARTAPHWIGGAVVAGGAERIEVVDPATGAVVGDVPAGSAADVDRAVVAARGAFAGW